jgi:methionyl-tRNA formyltransferase
MLTLYLMTEKGHQVLSAMVESRFASLIDKVIAARDIGVQNDFFEDIQALCITNNIEFYEKASSVKNTSKYSFAISWRWLIDAPNLIVLHDSLLPRYRGFAPLVSALINGDKKIGVTALFANKEFDQGDIIAQMATEIDYPIKINQAIKVVASLYTQITLDIVKTLENTCVIEAVKQNDLIATYSLWRDEEDYVVTWNENAAVIERFVNAVGFPYKGASTYIDGRIARIEEVEQIDDVIIENRTSGKVLFINNGMPTVVCGKGLLRINKLKWDDGTDALPLKSFRTRFK